MFNNVIWSLVGSMRGLFGDGFEMKCSFWIPATKSLDNKGNKDNILSSTVMEMLVLSDLHLLQGRVSGTKERASFFGNMPA